MHSVTRTTFSFLATALLLATALPAPAQAATTRIGFGFPAWSAGQVKADGGPIEYGTNWTGSWNDNGAHGNWNEMLAAIDKAHQYGVTPVIHWWYWGDDMSADCFDSSGCTDRYTGRVKSTARYDLLSSKLADAIRSRTSANEAILVLETEFNKERARQEGLNGFIDDMLAAKATMFKQRGIRVVAPFGSWYATYWTDFRDFVAASDYTGTMLLRSCDRDAAHYGSSTEYLLEHVGYLKQRFPDKQVMVVDYGLSSHDCDGVNDYEQLQRQEMAEVFSRLGELKAYDVFAIVFRALDDNPNFDPANYHGYGERYWGFRRADASWKPAYSVVLDGIRAEAGTNQAPAASFTASCAQRSCSVDGRASSDADGAIASYAWSWGDGASGAGATASHAYAADGTYTIRLTVTDDKGATGTAARSVTVRQANNPPVAAFTSACAGLACSFNGGGSYDPDGSVAAYAWTFGDGALGAGATTQHAYLASGTYSVRLTVTDNGGATGSATHTVTVTAPAPGYPVVPATVEAEAFASKSAGGSFTDPSLSGGAGWGLWSNGFIEQKVHNDLARAYDVVIAAKGDLAGPDLPRMVLRVDGAQAAAWDVVSTSLLNYSARVALPVGDVALRVEFTNDYLVNGQDRNLKLDLVRVEPENLPGTFEAEAFSSKPYGNLYSNTSFSGAQGWNLYQNGYVEHVVHNNGSTRYDVTVRAKGDYAGGAWPHMVLKANGAVLAQWDVTSETLLPYTVRATLPAGAVALRVEFTNDYSQNGQDRNLKVDRIQAALTYPQAPGRYEAESFASRPAGSSYANASFSGGAGWNLHGNGYVEHTVHLRDPKAFWVTVQAKGDYAGGAWPHMVLWANGVRVREWDVTSETALPYGVVYASPGGDVTFRVEFTNDYNANGQDRNLKLDFLEVQ